MNKDNKVIWYCAYGFIILLTIANIINGYFIYQNWKVDKTIKQINQTSVALGVANVQD